MAYLELKQHRDKYEINVFYNKHSKSHYTNIIDKDASKLAQILLDLELDGFPIQKAIKIFRRKWKEKDWLGI